MALRYEAPPYAGFTPSPSQHCSLSGNRTVLAPAHLAMLVMAEAGMSVRYESGPSKMPHPSMHAYSAPELLKPSSRTTTPSLFTMVLPLTRNPASETGSPEARGVAVGTSPEVALVGVALSAERSGGRAVLDGCGCCFAVDTGPQRVSPIRTPASATGSAENVHGGCEVFICPALGCGPGGIG